MQQIRPLVRPRSFPAGQSTGQLLLQKRRAQRRKRLLGRNGIPAYGRPFERYVRVTPGMTGLWQISGRNCTSFARRAELDLHYVMNWSLWWDVYILVRTVWVVLSRYGAC